MTRTEKRKRAMDDTRPRRKRVRCVGNIPFLSLPVTRAFEHLSLPSNRPTMILLHECASMRIEHALCEIFVPIAKFVEHDTEEYGEYRRERMHSSQSTLEFRRGGSLGLHRVTECSKQTQFNNILQIFDNNESLEVQAVIEFGIYRHRVPHARFATCDLMYATVVSDAQSVAKLWSCLRTGARLGARLLLIDIHRPHKRVARALALAHQSMHLIGYRLLTIRVQNRCLAVAAAIDDQCALEQIHSFFKSDFKRKKRKNMDDRILKIVEMLW